MKRIVVVMIFALLVVSGVVLASEKGSATEKTVSDKEMIQGKMVDYITENTAVDGTYSLDGVKATFDYLHSGLKEENSLYISCADFKAGDDLYDVDYYVSKEHGCEVVKEVLHKKNGEIVNKVLYREGQNKGSEHDHEEKGSGHKSKGSGY